MSGAVQGTEVGRHVGGGYRKMFDSSSVSGRNRSVSRSELVREQVSEQVCEQVRAERSEARGMERWLTAGL